MRIIIVASLLAETLAVSLFAAPQDQAAKPNIEQQLAAQYRPATVNRAGEIVTPGSVLVLQKNGLLMYTVANPVPPQSTYKNGKISRNPFGRGFGGDFLNAMAKPGASAAIDQRTCAAGEKLWVTKMDFRKDGVVFRLYSDPVDGVRYFGELKFPFAKNSVPPANELLGSIGEALAVQPDNPPAPPPPTPETSVTTPAAQQDQPAVPPPTVSEGLTIDQVVAIMGPPERIADLSSKKIYYYKDMKITFLDGKVADIQ
jgi:hypothetical protein